MRTPARKVGGVRRVSNFPVMRTQWPRIVDYREGQLRSYMVDARKRGNGRRYYFRELANAVRCARRLATQRENLGNAVLRFTHQELVMTAECHEMLAPWGK